MKIEVLALLLFTTIILTYAMEANTEDPLVFYLLAKIQQLESKIVAKTKIRDTNEVAEKVAEHKALATAASNDKCACPPAGIVNYIRWGNSTCPYGADTIYYGIVAGSWYEHYGGAADPLYLPHNSQYKQLQAG